MTVQSRRCKHGSSEDDRTRHESKSKASAMGATTTSSSQLSMSTVFGCVTTIAFETDDVDERLGREVAILDLLADQGSWSGDSLRSLANHVRDEAAPVSELITRTRFGPPAR